nr:T9SS type A sorting domain-containing protein [Bacteroidota bacterium]
SYNNVTTSCVYVGTGEDENGDKYKPDVKNLMSYARKECRFIFSPMQHDIMEYTAAFVRNKFTCTDPALVTEAITINGFCPGQTMAVSYHVNLPFYPGNTFTAELSASNGSFLNPEILGTVQDIFSGTLNVQLPLNASGNQYKIRVVSSDPALTSLTNGHNLIITNVLPNVSFSALSSICLGHELELSGGNPVGGIYSGLGVADGVFTANSAGSGTHNISYIFTNACTTLTATQSLEVETCLGIESASINGFGVDVFPNPAKENVMVKGAGFEAGKISIELFRITGELVQQEVIIQTGNEVFQKELSLSSCAAGIYFIKVSSALGSKVEKLIVY